MVILLGLVGIVLTTSCLNLYIASLDALVERLATLGCRRLPCCRLRQSDATLLLRLRLAASTLLLVAYMCVLAWFGGSIVGFGFGEGLYFAFQTMSTVGFGDFTISPARGSHQQHVVVGQMLMILPGLVVYAQVRRHTVGAQHIWWGRWSGKGGAGRVERERWRGGAGAGVLRRGAWSEAEPLWPSPFAHLAARASD